MKNKKVIIGIIVLVIFTVLGIICLSPKKPRFTSFTNTKNFYVGEYEEQYSKYESELKIEKGVEKIYIDGITKQGNIDITLVDPSNKEYKVTIKDNIQKEINVKQYGTWKYTINIYPDTDGSVTISNDKINHEQLIKDNFFYK